MGCFLQSIELTLLHTGRGSESRDLKKCKKIKCILVSSLSWILVWTEYIIFIWVTTLRYTVSVCIIHFRTSSEWWQRRREYRNRLNLIDKMWQIWFRKICDWRNPGNFFSFCTSLIWSFDREKKIKIVLSRIKGVEKSQKVKIEKECSRGPYKEGTRIQ